MSTWVVLQKPRSGYSDEPGISYEYPRSIPNGQQIQANDILIVAEPVKVTGDRNQIIGWGVVDSVITYVRNGKDMANAVYAVYHELSPRLSFEAVGGDPRNNRTNSINRVPEAAEVRILEVLTRSKSVARNSPQLELPLSIAAEPATPLFDQIQYAARQTRQGQGLFRKGLLVLYESKCALSGYTPNAVVDAAHIVPYAEGQDQDLGNGLLLRADLHNLFDDGLLRIEPNKLVVELSKELSKSPYGEMNGMPLRARVDGTFPSIDALDQHYRSFAGR
jgi:hypothetical protein